MKRFIFLLTILFSNFLLFAASVDTAVIYSVAMHKNMKCVVIKPDKYKNKSIRFPVVYLLHGYQDSFEYWIKEMPTIKNDADTYQVILVCPDAGYDSWYFDSPRDSTKKIETHISKEVVEYIDSKYRTIANRNHRAITGISMGGHGAFFIALRHTDLFGAVGSSSGVVDIAGFNTNPGLNRQLGDTLTYKDLYQSYSVLNMIEHSPVSAMAIILDCGIDDPFYRMNKRFHEKLLKLQIAHDYIERPGGHNNEYWGNAIRYQLLFFQTYFKN